MSVLSPREQTLFDVARAALPRWFFQEDDVAELVAAFAKQHATAWDQVDLWVVQPLIRQAFGVFLDQHAIDRGTRRQAGESDAALIARLRTVEDSVTLPALAAHVNGVLAAAGVVGTCSIVEMRKDKAFVSADAGGAPPALSYVGRGYRVGLTGPAGNEIIVILPYPTDAATAAGVAEAVRLKKAAGVTVQVERRQSP